MDEVPVVLADTDVDEVSDTVAEGEALLESVDDTVAVVEDDTDAVSVLLRVADGVVEGAAVCEEVGVILAEGLLDGVTDTDGVRDTEDVNEIVGELVELKEVDAVTVSADAPHPVRVTQGRLVLNVASWVD